MIAKLIFLLKEIVGFQNMNKTTVFTLFLIGVQISLSSAITWKGRRHINYDEVTTFPNGKTCSHIDRASMRNNACECQSIDHVFHVKNATEFGCYLAYELCSHKGNAK